MGVKAPSRLVHRTCRCYSYRQRLLLVRTWSSFASLFGLRLILRYFSFFLSSVLYLQMESCAVGGWRVFACFVSSDASSPGVRHSRRAQDGREQDTRPPSRENLAMRCSYHELLLLPGACFVLWFAWISRGSYSYSYVLVLVL